jgi:hypothetical protein
VSLTEILFWKNILLVLGFTVNPILVFVAFFFMCRRIEIVKNIRPVVFSLFVGVLIGFWIGFSPAIYFMTYYYGGLEQTTALIQLTSYSITGSFPLLFFTSLSAICLASIVKTT